MSLHRDYDTSQLSMLTVSVALLKWVLANVIFAWLLVILCGLGLCFCNLEKLLTLAKNEQFSLVVY